MKINFYKNRDNEFSRKNTKIFIMFLKRIKKMKDVWKKQVLNN